MADVPELGKVPQGDTGTPGVNTPSSGTYGEKAAQQQLEAQLPTMPSTPAGSVPPPPGPGPSPGPMAAPAPSGPSGPPGSPPPAGVPAAILQGGPPPPDPGAVAPPDPMQGAATAAQGRLLILTQLSTSPDVSATTREWASTMIKALVG